MLIVLYIILYANSIKIFKFKPWKSIIFVKGDLKWNWWHMKLWNDDVHLSNWCTLLLPNYGCNWTIENWVISLLNCKSNTTIQTIEHEATCPSTNVSLKIYYKFVKHQNGSSLHEYVIQNHHVVSGMTLITFFHLSKFEELWIRTSFSLYVIE